MDFKILPFEIKSTTEDGSTFAGYANCFNNLDAAQEIVAPGAFKDTLADFMVNGFIGGLNHDWSNPVGRPVAAREDDKGLFVEGKISPTQHGRDCMVLLKDRVIHKMSIGYKVQGDMMLDDAEAVNAYWKDNGYTPSAKDIAGAQYGARVLTKLYLYEFSPVTVPANSTADITRVKRYTAGDMTAEQEIETYLRDVSGFSQKAAKICVSGLKALYQRDVEEAPTPEPQEAKAEVEPIEPEPTTEAKTEETPTSAETKTEEPTQAPFVVPVVLDVAAAVHQSQVQALHADFQRTKARYGLR